MPLGSSTKRYETPNHPFQGERIASEHDLINRYGLKNKEELWRAQSELRRMRREAREILGQVSTEDDVESEGDEFLTRLKRYGYLDPEDSLEAVLALEVNDVLERRLQTIVYRQGLANTPDQARQFVSHGHITINDQRVRRPSYTVEVDEEDFIEFEETSPLADDLHPERAEGQ
ncbi:30S ribosomal protein S4 [Salinarchaeum sp. IM2453]|uniref:30S ribosomal protein S4 n=1 Tax=Salinarchaeum sp. IM2453 TaxID=2862870 RepID=UPI001C83422F|nr:30S ribosomal protein S4 [Salinarchaeum sp. IM2453]QZA87799.1 30S ribosomal protein S4 [Salinarchaeum sp. IM2453]